MQLVVKILPAMLLGAGLALALGFAPPPQGSLRVQLSVEVGFDGYFRDSAWVPAFVTVSNDGPAITGELRVRTQVRGVTFAAPIELPTQSRKQVTLYLTLDSYERGVQVDLLHNNILVAQAGSAIRLVQKPDVLYGVVTEATVGVVNLDWVRPFVGEAYQSNLSIEQIPTQAEALRALDVLLFDDADTGRLTPAQRQALADWVLTGGHLIVTGGAAWQRTVAGVADLLPVEIDGTATVADLNPLAAYLGRDATLSPTATIVTTGTAKPTAEVLFALTLPDQSLPLLVRNRHGQGVVDYIGADPMTEPLASWPYISALWTMLLTSVDQRPSWWAGFGVATNSWSRAQDAAQIIPFALPPSSVIAGFLAVYVLLIGPLNYLVLNRLKRREFAWATIPILILTFGVVAYLTGFGLRGTRAVVNRLNVVRVWPNVGRAQVDGLIGLWSPVRTTYTISTPEGYTLQPIPSGGALAGLTTTRIEESGRFTVRDVPVNVGSVRGFVTQGFLDAPPALAAEATVTLARGTDEATAWGSVTNTNAFALEDAVVLARGAAMPLGTLEPGASQGFSLRLPGYDHENPLGAPPAALGLDYRYDVSQYTYSYSSRAYWRSAITSRDILSVPDDFFYQAVMTERDRELRRRQALLNALIHDLHATAGRGNHVYLAAWSKQAPLDIELIGAEYTTIDSTLYLFQLPTAIDAPDGAVAINPHQMSWALSEASTRHDLAPVWVRAGYGMQSLFTLNLDDRVGFRFTPLPGSRPSEVTRLVLNLELLNPNSTAPGVALWDWRRGDWQVLPVGPGRNFIPDPARFVGPAGAVEVLLFNPTDSTPVSLMRVDITMFGVL